MVESLKLSHPKENSSDRVRNHDEPIHLPICIDLDGTLIRSDLLYESLLQLIRQRIFYVFLIPFWLLRGKAYLKAEIARHVVLDMDSLPVNEALAHYLLRQRDLGHRLYLFTAADGCLA